MSSSDDQNHPQDQDCSPQDDENCEHETNDDASALEHAILHARRGLRSDVQVFVDAVTEGEVYIPLSENMPNVKEGEEVEIGNGISFRPHMLLDPQHQPFAVCFTRQEYSLPIQTQLNWKTSDEELKFVHGPFSMALDLGQTEAEGQSIHGLVLNPGTERELVLTREEVGSIIQGRAIPLVGYIDELPEGFEDQTKVIEGAEAPPQALLQSLQQSEAQLADLVSFEVQTTFNPERDREPHLTLVLEVNEIDDQARAELANEVMESAGPHLPEPGYCDIVFRDRKSD
ncbi:MAG: SseB family protein [Polyangiaceae bacterium]|nr:SseB family protein [Polyangiaceae bacterium]